MNGQELDPGYLEDMAWFTAHHARQFRLRPPTIDDIPPGSAIERGARVIVLRNDPSPIRPRLLLPSTPPHLRRDSDATCLALLRRVGARYRFPDEALKTLSEGARHRL